MRIVTVAKGIALAGLLWTGNARAEVDLAKALHQPPTAIRTAFEYEGQLYPVAQTSEDTSDSPGDPPETSLDVGCDDAYGEVCDSCCSGCAAGGLVDPWTLPQPAFLACNGIEVGGWLSAGIFGNAHGALNNGPLGFNNLGNGFTFNQLWLHAEKAADTGGVGFDWGVRFDYVYGVDGPDTQAFGDGGWDFGWNSSPDYGSAIPQLYAELAYNDLTVKIGHFYTLIGWEVVTAPDNFFYSHAYTMYYAEPFTHTGFLAEWPVFDDLTAYGGWTMGWDSGWENLNNASTFLGGLSATLTDNLSLTWAVSAGDLGPGNGDLYMNSFVFEWNLTDDFTYIIQHDMGDNRGLGAGNNEWYGINQYFQYTLNDRWAAGMRYEWFHDDDGTRVVTGGAGNAGDYYALTAGLNYKPIANLIFRPEIRYDWYNGTLGGGQPFNGGADSEQFSGGFDFILTF